MLRYAGGLVAIFGRWPLAGAMVLNWSGKRRGSYVSQDLNEFSP